MKDIEIVPFPLSGYHPLVDFESWRVAVLRPCEDLLPENLNHLQKSSSLRTRILERRTLQNSH